MTNLARGTAAVIAAIAWIALAVQFAALFAVNGSAVLSLETMFVYFTITTNLLVAVVMTCVALGAVSSNKSSILAGTSMCILLVGLVYHFLLRGLRELSGGSAIADTLLHQITPVCVPLFWLLFLPRGRLRWSDPCKWAIYPLAYLVYALVRGGAIGRYPYPFLDVGQLGGKRVAATAAVLALAFLCSGFALVYMDRALMRPNKPGC